MKMSILNVLPLSEDHSFEREVKTTVWLFFLKMKMTVHVVLHLDEDKGSVRKNEAIENTSIIKISSFLRTDPLIVPFILP